MRAGRFGIVSRFQAHLAAFEWAFYEVKDVAGVWHDPIPGSIPMVSLFGDNRLAKIHPDWVQRDHEGRPANRSLSYFDWDTLCPSHPEAIAQVLSWLKRSHELSGASALRLDDVTYAREGFCYCAHCLEGQKQTGLDFEAYRVWRMTSLVETIRRTYPHLEIFFTLFPDPYPGHLERRFGLQPDQLAAFVDAFVVPIYDLHYATTYWLEVLASAFRERLSKPFWIELYGLSVPEQALAHAVDVASAYADGILIAYDNNLEKLKRMRERVVNG